MGTFHRITYHLVFGTRFRHRSISTDFQERLYEYIGGIVRTQNGHLIEIGGVSDHVHLLTNLTPAKAVSDVLREIKANSAKWINDEQLAIGRFEWQKGYGAFTVSYSNIESVQQYIRKQEEHHRTRTFRDEYVEFLKRHGVEFEERFLFEGEHAG